MVEWGLIFTHTHEPTVNRQIREFQYKLLHNVIPTNVFLAWCKLVDCDKCSLCNECEETYIHLFF